MRSVVGDVKEAKELTAHRSRAVTAVDGSSPMSDQSAVMVAW
jgi:hypothetical protein